MVQDPLDAFEALRGFSLSPDEKRGVWHALVQHMEVSPATEPKDVSVDEELIAFFEIGRAHV